MKKRERLSGTERRAEIISAAQRAFAEKGFHGTTTRELAAKAGVSEALLFKHFPSKEALHRAMLDHCLSSEAGQEYQRLLALAPSTAALAVLLHFMAETVIRGDAVVKNVHQLILRSMAEDNAFVKLMFKEAEQDLVLTISRCLKAGREAGDLTGGAELRDAEWFVQHQILMLSFMHLSDTPLVKYRTSPEQRVKEMVLFILRAVGVREEAIARVYNPKALAQFAASEYAHTSGVSNKSNGTNGSKAKVRKNRE